jgi:transposase-like protein
LVRNGLVLPQDQQHKRKYKRWERDSPMQLWQMDIMSGVFLVGGRECKLVTGIDDHSRYVVVAKVVARPTGRAVCDALAEAVERYGVPSELLTDNGKQFTGRFTKPLPAEVLFERFCRENGITQLLTKRRSPTTTGKIERWHQTLRRELLDESGEFASLDAAQAAIDAWVATYNTQRPHQSLGMRTPSQRFRPAPPGALDRLQDRQTRGAEAPPAPPPRAVVPIQAEALPAAHAAPFELDILVPAAGSVSLVGIQQVWLGTALSGRTVTLWVDRHSIHVSLDGAWVKTVPTRLSVEQLSTLAGRGSRAAGPAPAPAALPAGRRRLPAATVVDVDRTVTRDGSVHLAGTSFNVGAELAGQRITLRLDGHLMRVIANGRLAKTMPAPVPPDHRDRLTGARRAADPMPPPASALRVQRNVPTTASSWWPDNDCESDVPTQERP